MLPLKKKHKTPLLIKCLVVSFVLHLGALYIVFKSPITLKNKFHRLFFKSNPVDISATDAPFLDRELEEFLNEFSANPLLQVPLLKDAQSAQIDLSQLENKEPVPASLATASPPSIPSQPPLKPIFQYPAIFSAIPDNPALPLRQNSTLLESDLPHSDPQVQSSPVASYPIEMLALPLAYDETSPLAPSPSILPSQPLEIPSSQPIPNPNIDISTYAHLSPMDSYLPDQALFSLKWKDDFTITPTFFPDQDGYVFALNVIPMSHLENQKMKQNFYFLIDISSHIERHKATVFKKSILKALSSLKTGDQFNLFLLDNKIRRFSSQLVPYSEHALRLAEEFLEQKPMGTLFSSFDLFSNLEQCLGNLDDDEAHAAILLTNGKNAGSASTYQQKLSHFLDQYRGKLNLFVAAVGHGNDLVHLDMLSSLCGGKLLYSDTNASFPRKLGHFVKTFRSPLAKNISIALSTEDSKAEISIFPLETPTPNVYANESFLIMGRINRLVPLRLTMEGWSSEGWMLLEKDISFENAAQAGNYLKKEWTLRQTASLYNQFLQDAKPVHLKEAKELLKSAHGRVLGE